MWLMVPAAVSIRTAQRSSPDTSAGTGIFEIIALEARSAGGATRSPIQMEDSPCVHFSVLLEPSPRLMIMIYAVGCIPASVEW